jgi:hypothetical protein
LCPKFNHADIISEFEGIRVLPFSVQEGLASFNKYTHGDLLKDDKTTASGLKLKGVAVYFSKYLSAAS